MRKFWVAYLFLAMLMAGLFLVAQIPYFWHGKFFIDGQTIIESTRSISPFVGSYKATAWLFAPILDLLEYSGIDLFQYSTVFDENWMIANLVWATPYVLLLWALVKRTDYGTDPISITLLFVLVTAYAPYYAAINKDIVPALCSFAVAFPLLIGRIRLALAVFFSVILLYGIFVRSYFLIFLVISIITFALSFRRSLVVCAYAAIPIAIYLTYSFLPRALIDIGRAEYLADVASSRIVYFFADDGALGFTLNRVSAFFRIAVPLELIPKSPAYALFVIYRVGCSILAVLALGSRAQRSARLSSSAIISFTAVQALFEPDFGSSFRHFMTMTPFVVVLYSCWHRTRFNTAGGESNHPGKADASSAV